MKRANAGLGNIVCGWIKVEKHIELNKNVSNNSFKHKGYTCGKRWTAETGNLKMNAERLKNIARLEDVNERNKNNENAKRLKNIARLKDVNEKNKNNENAKRATRENVNENNNDNVNAKPNFTDRISAVTSVWPT